MQYLTPQFLTVPTIDDDLKLLSPSVGLVLDRGGLFVVGRDAAGYVGRTPLPAPSELLVVRVRSVGPPDRAVTPTAWWACLTHADRAVRAVLNRDWEAAGAAIDRAYLAERESLLPPDAVRDLAYAAARSGGAWGGRPQGESLALLAPVDKHEAIRKAIRDVVGT